MQIEMRVVSLTVDPITNLPMVILKDPEGRQAIPIWIGAMEAAAIATELEGIKLDRPTPHDLIRSLLGLCGAQIRRVEVHDLRDGTFYASIVVARDDEPDVTIDARPSDAIALALRTGADILVAQEVIDKARVIDLRKKGGLVATTGCRARAAEGRMVPTSSKLCGCVEVESGGEMLEGLGEAAFGKWKM